MTEPDPLDDLLEVLDVIYNTDDPLERLAAIRRSVDLLEDAQALELVSVSESNSQREIARRIGVSQQAISKQMPKARKRAMQLHVRAGFATRRGS
jgi:predicted DNA-binding protein (UPF0251 family)